MLMNPTLFIGKNPLRLMDDPVRERQTHTHIPLCMSLFYWTPLVIKDMLCSSS